MEVSRAVESDWGISQFSIHFDSAEINPGGGTSSYIAFATPDGTTYVQGYQGDMQMQKPLKANKAGDKKAVILTMNGYGFKYYYEWKE